MKRMICILLLLALLLTGCTASDSTGNTCRAEDDAAADNTLHGETPAEDDLPVVETEPDTEPDTSGTTASGITVHTDYTYYTPHQSIQQVYTRLTEEFIPDLQPSDEYGMLYPYVGSLLYSVGGNGYSYQAGEMYGFVDAAGRIVADATYTGVQMLSYYDYQTGASVRVPMLSFSRPGESTLVEGDGWSYINHQTLYGLSTLDGSFVLPCEYEYISALGCGVVVMENYLSDTFTLYDFEGNILLTEQDLALGSRREEYSYSSMQYNDGYFSIQLTDGRWILGSDGSLLHGPYYNINTYRGGLAAASPDGEHYGFVDYDGNWVIEPIYNAAYCAGDNRFLAFGNGSEIIVFDAQGAEQFRIRGDYCDITEYGYSTGFYRASGKSYYDHDGELLWQNTGDWYDVGYLGSVVSRSTDDGIELRNIVTGASATVPGSEYAGQFYSYEDYVPLDVPYIFLYGGDGLTRIVSTEDFSLVHTLGEDAWIKGERDPVTGQIYMVEAADNAYRLYDLEFTLLGTFSTDISIYNGLVRTTDDWSCSWQTLDGTILFRYPLVTSLAD